MALFGLLGGSGGKDDDPYADILTPGQRNQMLTQGLLAMAGAFADAGMPSRLPIPFGAALGKAAAALGTGQDAAMTSALAGAYRAQQIRDLRAKAALQAKLNPLFQQVLDQARGSGGATTPTLPLPGPGARPGPGALPGPGGPAAADGPLTLDQLPYPDTAGGGLLGGGDTDLTGGLPGNAPSGGSGADTDLVSGGGLLAPATATRTPAATNRQAYGVATPEEREAWIKSREAGGQDTIQAFVMKYRLRPRTTEGSGGGLLGEGSGRGGGAADLGAGGDDATPIWNPTFPQAAARGAPASGDPLDIIAKYESGGRNIMQQVLGPQGGYNPSVGRVTGPSSASGPWQMIDPTWRDAARKTGVDTQQYPTAISAPVDVQRKVAQTLFDEQGYTPWAPYNRNLAQAVGYTGGRGAGATTEGSGGSTEPDPYANLTPRPAGGAPLAAPGGVPLAAPSTLPQLAPPGATLGSGGKIPGLNMSPQELAVIDAMAESAGLGNPFKGLLDTYYKSPGYLQESAGATAKGRIAEEEPSQLRVQAAKARADFIQKLSENALTLDKDNNVVEIPGMRGMLGKTAGEIEAAKEQAKAQFQTVEARVLGPDGLPTTEKMTQYEFSFRRQQQAANAALGASPKPGDIIGAPALNKAEEALGPGSAEDVLKVRTVAQDAAQSIETTKEARKLLDSGIFAGAGSDKVTALAKIGNALNLTGTNTKETVSNTEAYFATVAGNVGRMIKQFGSGTGLSDADREYAAKMAAGQQTLDEASIRKILDINDRAGFNVINRHNTSVAGIRPGASLTPLTVPVPTPYQRVYPEGFVIENPQTGERQVRRNGNWEAMPK